MNIEFIVTFSSTVLGAVMGAYLTVRIMLAKLQSEYSNLKERVNRESEENNSKFKKSDDEIKEVSRILSFIKGKLVGIDDNLKRLLENNSRRN